MVFVLRYLVGLISTLLCDVPFTWQPRATVMLVKKVWYLRNIYYFAVRKNRKNIATIKYPKNAKKLVTVPLKFLILSINILLLLGVISYVRFLLPIFLSDSCGVFIDLKKALNTR